MDKANRGLRFFGATQKAVAASLSTIADKNGFDRIIAFLEIINILTESKEYEALASVGYTHNFTHFNKMFKQFTGKVPREYRKSWSDIQ